MNEIKIFKIVNKKSHYFLVETENGDSSYPNMKSLKVDFPNVNKSDIIHNNKLKGVIVPDRTQPDNTNLPQKELQCIS